MTNNTVVIYLDIIKNLSPKIRIQGSHVFKNICYEKQCEIVATYIDWLINFKPGGKD